MSTTTDTSTARSLARFARPVVAAALCAAFVVAAPVPAQAQTLTDPDAVGDMITFNADDADVPVPERTLNDVTRTRLTHGTTRVAIRVDYVDLKKGGDDQAINIFMVTNEVRRTLGLVAYPRHWYGGTYMVNGNGREVRCDGVRHRIDYQANFMRVSFPRRCASNPRWVKFQVVASARADGYYADDALSDSATGSQDSNDLARSGRIFRH